MPADRVRQPARIVNDTRDPSGPGAFGVLFAGRRGFTSSKIVVGPGGAMVLMKTGNVWHKFGREPAHERSCPAARFGVPPPIIDEGFAPCPRNVGADLFASLEILRVLLTREVIREWADCGTYAK